MRFEHEAAPVRVEERMALASVDLIRFQVIRSLAASPERAPPKVGNVVKSLIALHTTPGIPEHKKAVVALVTAGVEMDVLGFA